MGWIISALITALALGAVTGANRKQVAKGKRCQDGTVVMKYDPCPKVK